MSGTTPAKPWGSIDDAAGFSDAEEDPCALARLAAIHRHESTAYGHGTGFATVHAMDPRRKYRLIALWLLFFNGITASWGASGLLQGRTGEHLGYDLDLLAKTPFADYFWPGVILLVANGLLCLLVAVLTLKRVKSHPWLILFQGLVLLGWLSAELMWGIAFPLLQALYGAVALGLVWSGFKLRGLASIKPPRDGREG